MNPLTPSGSEAGQVRDIENVIPDSRLTKFSAKLKYTTGRGTRIDMDCSSGKAGPHKTLLAVIGELARIAAVAGLEHEARAECEESFKAVAEWRAESEAAA